MIRTTRVLLPLLLWRFAIAESEPSDSIFEARLREARQVLNDSPESLELIQTSLVELSDLLKGDPSRIVRFSHFAQEVESNSTNVTRIRSALSLLKKALADFQSADEQSLAEQEFDSAIVSADGVEWVGKSKEQWIWILCKSLDVVLARMRDQRHEQDTDKALFLPPLRIAGKLLSKVPDASYPNSKIEGLFHESDPTLQALISEMIVDSRAPRLDMLARESEWTLSGTLVFKNSSHVILFRNESDSVAEAALNDGLRWKDYVVDLCFQYSGGKGFEILQRAKPDAFPGCVYDLDSLFEDQAIRKGEWTSIRVEAKGSRFRIGRPYTSPQWKRCSSNGAAFGPIAFMIPPHSTLAISSMNARVFEEEK